MSCSNHTFELPPCTGSINRVALFSYSQVSRWKRLAKKTDDPQADFERRLNAAFERQTKRLKIKFGAI